MHRAHPGMRLSLLDGDGEFVGGVAAEVAAGQLPSERFTFLGALFDPAGVLAPDLIAGSVESVVVAVDDVDRAGVLDRSKVLTGRGDGEVRRLGVVEVAGGEVLPERVASLGRAANAESLLVECAASAGGEAGRGAVDDLYGPGVGNRAHVLCGDADGQIGLGAFSEIRCGEAGAEGVFELD